MPDDAEIAVIEMGANRPNDIGELCEIALPDFGVITNIGSAHLEGFGGREGVKKAKGQMYDFIKKSGGKIFLHVSDPVLKALSEGIPYVGYSSDDTEASVTGGLNARSLLVQFYWEDKSHKRHEVQTRLTGSYNLPNLLAAACIAQYFEVDSNIISKQLAGYTPSNNRSQVSRSEHNTLIMDAYNANPSSTESAIRDFARFESDESRLAILGDMLELGDETQSAHSAIIHLLKSLKADAILIGAAYCAANEETQGGFPSFSSTDEAINYLASNPLSGKLILLKGSRGLQLEKLIPLL
jgi:UDP-N-acetylmuramoyl-tripeptide--D-alanyl-D-alanine ligase